MSPKQLTPVLLTVAVAVMVISAQVTLNETKERVEVLLGSSLTLYCGLRMANQERVWVSWLFNRSGSSCNDNTEKISEVLKNETEETLPKYSLSNVTYNNSGWYFCKVTVEIPFFKMNWSQGTEVVIMKTVKEHTTYQSQVPVSPTNTNLLDKWWLWIILGVSSLVLIVLLIVCVLLTSRLYGRRDTECPVYENMHKPSPRPGTPASNLKTVSSSQNLRNPSPGGRYGEGKRKHNQ